MFNSKTLKSGLKVSDFILICGFEERNSCLWEQALTQLGEFNFSQQPSNCVLWELQVCNAHGMRQLSGTELDLPHENAGANDLTDFTGLVS